MRRPGEARQGVLIADLATAVDLTSQLRGVRAIVHCAARVHKMQDDAEDPLLAFREINRDATIRLAEQGAAAGVERFVFLSSIKVNGESTRDGLPFRAEDPPRPVDPYGVSKAEAEDGLRKVALTTGMDVVIVRPPLVYGPGVRANFAALVKLLRRRLPLPFGRVTGNRRSMVALDNLVDFLVVCLTHTEAVNQTFLVSDGEDISTATLLRRLGAAMDRPARLLPVPVSVLTAFAGALGAGAAAQRLLNSLQIDISKAYTLLGWRPPISLDEGLRRAAER